MKNLIIALAAVIVSLTAASVCPSNEPDKKPSDDEKSTVWMQKKLEYSQNILAGLTEGDFDKISKNAKEMNFMDYLERWTRAGSPDYKRQVSYFEFANKELIRQAKEKNVDGATLAYNQLTVSCVQCHKIVRDSKK
jgi:cytochrome c556